MTKSINNLKKHLLLEAIDMSSGASLLKAIQRGQVPYLKYKDFSQDEIGDKEAISLLNSLLVRLRKIRTEDKVASIIPLLLVKAGAYTDLEDILGEPNLLETVVESIEAYFGNVNKKEVKENPEFREKFEEFRKFQFSRSGFTLDEAGDFIDFVNKNFAHKAVAKEKDIEIVFKNKEWLIVEPKTFAAARKFACMNSRKANWCTSANIDRYKEYTKDGTVPIYILRNKTKNIMYQAHFDGRMSGFSRENNTEATLGEIKRDIPKEVLNKIKNEDGVGLYDVVFARKDFDLDTDKSLKETKGNLEFKTLEELEKEFEKYGSVIKLLSGLKRSSKGVDSKEEASSVIRAYGMKNVGIDLAGRYNDGKNTYFYIVPSLSHFGFKMKFEVTNTKTKDIKTYSGPSAFVVDKKGGLRGLDLKSFLRINLPESLEKKLNETKDQETVLKGSRAGIKPLKTIGATMVFKVVNNLRAYLNIHGLTNNNLTRIKEILNDINTNKSDFNKSLIFFKSDSNSLFFTNNVFNSKFVRAVYPQENSGSVFVTKNVPIMRLTDKSNRKELFNFFMEKGYFTFDHYKNTLGANTMEKIVDCLLGDLKKEVEIKNFNNGFTLSLLWYKSKSRSIIPGENKFIIFVNQNGTKIGKVSGDPKYKIIFGDKAEGLSDADKTTIVKTIKLVQEFLQMLNGIDS